MEKPERLSLLVVEPTVIAEGSEAGENPHAYALFYSRFGAKIGDAIAIRIKDISITSTATSSGNDVWVDGRYMGDPYVAKYDFHSEELNRETYVDGIGEDAIKYKSTGKPTSPFKLQ